MRLCNPLLAQDSYQWNKCATVHPLLKKLGSNIYFQLPTNLESKLSVLKHTYIHAYRAKCYFDLSITRVSFTCLTPKAAFTIDETMPWLAIRVSYITPPNEKVIG